MADVQKHWSYVTGEKGRNRVRAFEDPRTGLLYYEFYEQEPGSPRPKRKAVALGHRDREKAEQQAKKLAEKLADGDPAPVRDIRLRELFDIYGREVTPQKATATQRHDRAASEMFLRFFGPERKAKTLNRRDWDAFIRERKAGRIKPKGRGRGKKEGVGPRTIAHDLVWLRAVLNWATLAGDGGGGYLLERNPLKGLSLPKKESPDRPVVTDARYKAMLGVAADVDWRFELALVLAYETGHRIGAIRHLRWSDVDLDAGRVTWRGDVDKIGHRHTTPLTKTAVQALASARKHNPAIGDTWMFPSPQKPDRPCSASLMRDWWLRAESKAKLEHIKGLGWHGLRRRFATDMKDVPLRDLADLGGWKTHRTIVECYQVSDEESMREALEQRKAASA